MASLLYLWDGNTVRAVHPITGRIIRTSVQAPPSARSSWGSVLPDGRVVISSYNFGNELGTPRDVPGYALLNAGMTHWSDGPRVQLGVLPTDTGWTLSSILGVGGKVVAFARAVERSWWASDFIIQFRSLTDLTPIHFEQLVYDNTALEGDESPPEAPAISHDTVYYTTEGGYTHAVNVNTWVQTRPINILTDSVHYSEDENPVFTAGAIDTDMQGAAFDAATGRVWSYAYNEQAGHDDVWNPDEIQIFSGIGDNDNWRLEYSSTPPDADTAQGMRGFSGTGAVIGSYYYLCPDDSFISRFNLDTKAMEWRWFDVSATERFTSFSILAGGGNGAFGQPIPGAQLASGMRFDPAHEPGGARMSIRT